MKIAIIIMSVILLISSILRMEIVNISKNNPMEIMRSYNSYKIVAECVGITFIVSLISDVVLVLIYIL